jgi:hypothetical protein
VTAGSTRRYGRFVAGAAIAALATSGCTSTAAGPLGNTTPTVTASPSPTVDPAVAEAETQALATYVKFRRFQVSAEKTGRFSQSALATFVGDPLLSDQVANLYQQESLGITFVGDPTWKPAVTGADLTANPPTVTIQDCYKTSGFHPVQHGKRVPVASATPSVVLKVEVENVRGVWYVFGDDPVKGKTC